MSLPRRDDVLNLLNQIFMFYIVPYLRAGDDPDAAKLCKAWAGFMLKKRLECLEELGEMSGK